ncbi:hypothetical protein D3C87_1473490 [compost metagenome]
MAIRTVIETIQIHLRQNSVDVLVFADVVRRIRQVQVFRNRGLVNDIIQFQDFDFRYRQVHGWDNHPCVVTSVGVSTKVNRWIVAVGVSFKSTVGRSKRYFIQRCGINVVSFTIDVLYVHVRGMEIHPTLTFTSRVTLTNR